MVGLVVAAPGKVTLLRAKCGHTYLRAPLSRSGLHTSWGVQGCGNGVAGGARGRGSTPSGSWGQGVLGQGWSCLWLLVTSAHCCVFHLAGRAR